MALAKSVPMLLSLRLEDGLLFMFMLQQPASLDEVLLLDDLLEDVVLAVSGQSMVAMYTIL